MSNHPPRISYANHPTQTLIDYIVGFFQSERGSIIYSPPKRNLLVFNVGQIHAVEHVARHMNLPTAMVEMTAASNSRVLVIGCDEKEVSDDSHRMIQLSEQYQWLGFSGGPRGTIHGFEKFEKDIAYSTANPNHVNSPIFIYISENGALPVAFWRLYKTATLGLGENRILNTDDFILRSFFNSPLSAQNVLSFLRYYFLNPNGHPKKSTFESVLVLPNLFEESVEMQHAIITNVGLQTAQVDLYDGRRLIILGWREELVNRRFHEIIQQDEQRRKEQRNAGTLSAQITTQQTPNDSSQALSTTQVIEHQHHLSDVPRANVPLLWVRRLSTNGHARTESAVICVQRWKEMGRWLERLIAQV